jgi:hypothetical protein
MHDERCRKHTVTQDWKLHGILVKNLMPYWNDPPNKKIVRFEFWRKMRNYLVSRQQS